MELQGKKEVTHKKLAHVQVYEALYKMVEDGTFPVGSRLPAEPKLAKMLGVSRMTLRHREPMTAGLDELVLMLWIFFMTMAN